MSAQSEDRLQMLFPTVIQTSDISEASTLNRELLSTVHTVRETVPSSKPQSWACDLYTTIGNPSALSGLPGIGRLLEIGVEKMKHYAAAYSYPQHLEPRITDCWVNVYTAGQSQEIHLHKNSFLSGIYYLQVSQGAGATLFYSPSCDVMLEPQPTKGNNLNATVTGFPPESGRMLVFRSSTRHSVLPGNFHGERITISFNAVV